MKRIALYFGLVPAMMFFSGGVSRAAKQQGSVGAYRQQCPQELGGTQSQAGLQTNNLSSPSGAMDITQKFNFTPCSASAGLASCYDGLFSDLGGSSYYNIKIFDQPLNYLQIKCASTHDKPCDEIPLSYVGNPATSYVRKAFSTPKYVRLGLWGPGMSRFNFNAVASGPKLNFKFYESFTMLNTPDVSDAVTAKVEVYGANGATLISQSVITPVCADVGIYDPDKQSRSLFYPAGVYPILRTCEYRDGSISIPPQALGQEISVRWRLTAHEGFNNPAGSGCKTPDNRPATCSPFTPYAFLSLDDIRFEAPSTLPTLACDSYEVGIGENPKCKLTENGRPVPSNSPWLFRVWKQCETQRPPAQSISSAFTAAGMYSVDGVCQKTLSNGKKVFCGKTAKMANIRVNFPGPLAAFVSQREVRIALPENTDPTHSFAGDTPATVSIFRKNAGSGNGQEIASLPYLEMRARGASDQNVQSGTMYAYRITYQSGRQGPESGWDTVTRDASSVTLWTDHLPLPGTPMNILADVKGATQRPSSITIARAPSADPVRPSTLGFSGDSRRKTFAPFEKVNASGRGFLVRAAWVRDPTILNPQAEAADYNSPVLPPTTDFFVLSGPDFTTKKWTPEALQIVLAGIGQVPGLTADQCEFLGNQFQCKSNTPSPITMFRFPTVPADAMKAMIAYHYGEYSSKDLTGGFLRCPECRLWLTKSSPAIFGNKIDFRNSDPERDCPLGRFGEAGYTRQCTPNSQSDAWAAAASLATFDATKMTAVVRDPVWCLTDPNCPARARGSLFADQNNRYGQAYLDFLATNFSVLTPPNAMILAQSSASTLSYFFKPMADDYARMALTEPFRQTVDSMQFIDPANLAPEEQQSWQNVYKSYLQNLVRQNIWSTKGFLVGILENLAIMPPCAEGTVMDTVGVEQCQRDKQSLLEKLERFGSRLLGDDAQDPTAIRSYETGRGIATGTFVIAGTFGAATTLAKASAIRTTVPLKVTVSTATGNQTTTIVAGTATDMATGAEISRVAVSAREATQTAKIVEIVDNAIPPSSVAPQAEVKMIETAVRSAAPETVELTQVRALSSGDVVVMAEDSALGDAAYRLDFSEATTTPLSDNAVKVRFRKPPEPVETPLPPAVTAIHPQGINPSEYAGVIASPPNFVFPRLVIPHASSGTSWGSVRKAFRTFAEGQGNIQQMVRNGYIGPRSGKSRGIPLANHLLSAKPRDAYTLPDGRMVGMRGGGPTPEKGWISTTADPQTTLPHYVGLREKDGEFIVLAYGRVGPRSIAFDASTMDGLMDTINNTLYRHWVPSREITYPNLIPLDDVERFVLIRHRPGEQVNLTPVWELPVTH